MRTAALTKRDNQVLELFDDRGNWTVSEAAGRIGVGRESLRHNFEKLVRIGFLDRHHVDRAHLPSGTKKGGRKRRQGRPSTMVYNRTGRGDLRPIFLDLLNLLEFARDQERDLSGFRGLQEAGEIAKPYDEVPDPLSDATLRSPIRMDLGDVLLHREALRFVARLIRELGLEELYPIDQLDDRWKEPKPVAMRVHSPILENVPGRQF